MLRVVFDINVWVANTLAALRHRDGTSCQRLVESLIIGQCRLGPLASNISHAMLDTFETVLEREFGMPPDLVDAARNIAQEACSHPPLAVLGGGVQPVKDIEDLSVLETALAVRADILVTHNMKDFTPGPRAQLDADIIRSKAGTAEVVLVRQPGLPHGLVITTPYAAKAWLIDGYPPPPGVLERFLPG